MVLCKVKDYSHQKNYFKTKNGREKLRAAQRRYYLKRKRLKCDKFYNI
jgi:hypothetical protein